MSSPYFSAQRKTRVQEVYRDGTGNPNDRKCFIEEHDILTARPILPAAIETGTEDGMLTFDQCIYHQIRNGVITEEDGLMRCDNPEALKMNLKGIFLNESRRIPSSVG